MKQGHEGRPTINIRIPIGDYSLLVSLTKKVSERIGNKVIVPMENSFIHKEHGGKYIESNQEYQQHPGKLP